MKKKRNARSRFLVEVEFKLDPTSRSSMPHALLALRLACAARRIKEGQPPDFFDRAVAVDALTQLADRVAEQEPAKNSSSRMAGRADLIQRAIGGTLKAAIARAIKEARADESEANFKRVNTAVMTLRKRRRSCGRKLASKA